MLSIERPQQTVNDGVLTEGVKPACTALVPMVPTVQWSQPVHLQRPDSTFVTQLIATAESIPQSRKDSGRQLYARLSCCSRLT